MTIELRRATNYGHCKNESEDQFFSASHLSTGSCARGAAARPTWTRPHSKTSSGGRAPTIVRACAIPAHGRLSFGRASHGSLAPVDLMKKELIKANPDELGELGGVATEVGGNQN
jgi:hypothetical protein